MNWRCAMGLLEASKKLTEGMLQTFRGHCPVLEKTYHVM